MAATRYYPCPRSTLELPVVKFSAKSSDNGALPHQLPSDVIDALSSKSGNQITLVTNGYDAHQQHFGWVTARLNKATLPLSDGGRQVDARANRLILYKSLKHSCHSMLND